MLKQNKTKPELEKYDKIVADLYSGKINVILPYFSEVWLWWWWLSYVITKFNFEKESYGLGEALGMPASHMCPPCAFEYWIPVFL